VGFNVENIALCHVPDVFPPFFFVFKNSVLDVIDSARVGSYPPFDIWIRTIFDIGQCKAFFNVELVLICKTPVNHFHINLDKTIIFQ
jgi:hypothetical protein